MAAKHVVDRSVLERQKAANREFDRERRLGTGSLDIDFAESLAIEEARLLQSDHWCTKTCTLFMGIFQCLSVEDWDRTAGDIAVGAEVTAFGELSGLARRADSFWAKVEDGPTRPAGGAVDVYRVRDAKGAVHEVPRNELRVRVMIKEAHAGVTGDKIHDSYSMRFFVAKMVKALRDKGVLARNKITVLCVHMHSDNAAQHFKSSKSLHWLSRQLFEMGFTSVLWDFGPPGHGKGDKHTHTRYFKRPSPNSIIPELTLPLGVV